MIAAAADTELAETKARIARALLDHTGMPAPNQIGRITLRPHQADAVLRLQRMISRQGGAVLADAVGLGKTFVALAVARQYRRPLIVAPAALRDMWARAAHDAGLSPAFVTTQALSTGTTGVPESPDLVIVDEAHHLRSHLTNRYAALASVCRSAHVLLLSATPVQNRREDLLTQIALFLGSRAAALTDAQLGEFVIRRDTLDDTDALPAISGPHGVRLPIDDDLLDDLLALPAPTPASDEGVAGALGMYTLLHLWSSSRAALVGSLRRRRARAHAMRDVLDSGRLPTRRELTAWRFEDGAQQLALTDLLFSGPAAPDASTRLVQVDVYITAITALLDRAKRGADPDRHRADLLETLLETHRGERIVVFSQYAETVSALGGWLRRSPGIAVMTARGARIASGVISRADVLAQFDPADTRSRSTRAVERIDMLVTTDVLSEGVNLHDASVVVHLDLPWNPARLEQRLGRVRRLGSRHDVVTAYAVMPAAPVERLIGIEQRLRTKLATAREAVGSIGSVLPGEESHASGNALDAAERTRAVVATWRRSDAAWNLPTFSPLPALVAVSGDRGGILAVVAGDGETIVLAGSDTLSRDPATVEALVDQIDRAGDVVAVPEGALRPLTRWLDADRARTLSAENGSVRSRAQRDALARIARVVEAAPRHRRSSLAPLAAAARAAVSQPLNVGAERELAELGLHLVDDEGALSALGHFGDGYGERADRAESPGLVIAVIVVVGPTDARGGRASAADGLEDQHLHRHPG